MQDYADNSSVKKALYPAVDASMITQMKRRAAITADLRSHGTNGRKGMGILVDGQHTRGFDGTSVRPTLLNAGGGLTFLRVL
jgi:hypothetical protein